MLTFILLEIVICLLALTEEASTDFNDLGKLMLAGLAAAIVFALGFTFIRFKLRDKSPQTSNFISIRSTQEKDSDS
jgi:hypothetical protein